MVTQILVERHPHGRIELVQGDLVDQHVDAVVNAANTTLLGGGGVDGAVHRAAGPELLDACRVLPADGAGRRCPTGEARVTPGFALAARWVIHAVGPVYEERYRARAEALLQQTYRAAFAAAAGLGVRTIALPAISAGAYRFPLDAAARIAVAEARTVVDRPGPLEAVRFVLFDRAAFEAFAAQSDGVPVEVAPDGQLPLGLGR